MGKNSFHREVRLGSASNFETFFTVRKLTTPADTVELRFETVFAGAKDPQTRQTKAQFFVTTEELTKIGTAVSVGTNNMNQVTHE